MDRQQKDSGAIAADPAIEEGGDARAPSLVPRVVESARRADAKLVALVRERPIATLCAAALMGYVIGRVVTRLG